MKKIFLIAAIMILFFTTGCATLITGTTQNVYVNSDPPGAEVKINGRTLVTPGNITLPRKNSYHITVEKEGYETEHVRLEKSFNPVTLVGLAWCGMDLFACIIVDLVNGAAFKLTPETIVVHLRKIGEKEARIKKKREEKKHTPPRVTSGRASVSVKKGIDFSKYSRIGVLDFKCPKTVDSAQTVDIVSQEILKLGFDVIDRVETERILKEQGFQLTDITDAKTRVKVGKILGVDAMVTGVVTTSQTKAHLTVKMIDVSTGAILWYGRCHAESENFTEALDHAMVSIREKLQDEGVQKTKPEEKK